MAVANLNFINQRNETHHEKEYVKVIRTMYQLKVDVDMLNAVKSVLADLSSVSPSSEQQPNCSYTSSKVQLR